MKYPAIIMLATLTAGTLLLSRYGEASPSPSNAFATSPNNIRKSAATLASLKSKPKTRRANMPSATDPRICDHADWDHDLEFRQCYEQALGDLGIGQRHSRNED